MFFYSTEHEHVTPQQLFFLVINGSAATIFRPRAEQCILPSTFLDTIAVPSAWMTNRSYSLVLRTYPCPKGTDSFPQQVAHLLYRSVDPQLITVDFPEMAIERRHHDILRLRVVCFETLASSIHVDGEIQERIKHALVSKNVCRFFGLRLARLTSGTASGGCGLCRADVFL